jgi:hypothetical protein
MGIADLINLDVAAESARRADAVGRMCQEVLSARFDEQDATLESYARALLAGSSQQQRLALTLFAEAFGMDRLALKKLLRAAGLCGDRD